MKELNESLCKIMLSINVVVIIATIIFGLVKARPLNYCLITCGVALISFIVISIAYKKIPNSNLFRYIVLACNSMLYFCFVFLSGINTGYMVGIVVSFIYIFYMDIKLCIALSGVVIGMTSSFIGYSYLKGGFPEGNLVTGKNSMMIIGSICVFSGLLIVSTIVSKKVADSQIEEIDASNLKFKELIRNILDTSRVVKNSVKEGVRNINELDNAIDETKNIFGKINRGNQANAESVELQTEMSMKITGLIDCVVDDADSAKGMTIESIDELNNSKKSIEELKGVSDDIMEVNKELLDAINDFVVSVRDVKNITDGINEISDQTNLLSLNASIESAKAGDIGKGFAIVAEEVRKLSEETNNLTNDIGEIVSVLEKDALQAQQIINEVEIEINEENTIINDTIEKFINMEDNMKELKDGVDRIITSTKDVVKYNNNIMEHIEHLSAETEEVTAYIEEVTVHNGINKKKAEDTKVIMNDISDILEMVATNN